MLPESAGYLSVTFTTEILMKFQIINYEKMILIYHICRYIMLP